MGQALDRDALYYPYIHIRDVNWLKATLLSFPQVRRMVPHDFSLNDNPEVRQFCHLSGPRGPLLMEQDLMVGAVVAAQVRLKNHLYELEPQVLAGLSQETTARACGGRTDIFQIHRHKFVEDLFFSLEDRGLIWPSRQPYQGEYSWYGLHPKLGEAIMSTIAIALAQEFGLDIVTDSGEIHYSLASLNEEAVFQTLMGGGAIPAASPGMRVPEMVDELLMLVMTTRFDVRRLSAEQIADLIQDGKSLYEFKKHLAPKVSGIPDIRDPQERKKRLKAAADEVMAEWEKYRRALPSYAKEALNQGVRKTLPDFVKKMGPAIAAGSVTAGLLGALPGLALGFVVYGGLSIFKKYQERSSNPYRYLSRLQKAGATLMVTLPHGVE